MRRSKRRRLARTRRRARRHQAEAEAVVRALAPAPKITFLGPGTPVSVEGEVSFAFDKLFEADVDPGGKKS